MKADLLILGTIDPTAALTADHHTSQVQAGLQCAMVEQFPQAEVEAVLHLIKVAAVDHHQVATQGAASQDLQTLALHSAPQAVAVAEVEVVQSAQVEVVRAVAQWEEAGAVVAVAEGNWPE
jgi:hypothetical protein